MHSTNKIDVIIFGGQSNMQGESEALSENEVVNGAFEYKFLSNSIQPLKNPVGEDVRYDGGAGYPITTDANASKNWLSDHVLGSACYGYTNLVPAFVRAYVKECSQNVMAVHAAKGSTSIAYWMPSTPGYQTLVSKASAAIKKASETYCVEHVYFVWLQGESDAIESRSKAYYKEKIMLLAQNLKDDLAIDRFGIIRVGRFTNDERDEEIISAQDEICRESSLFLMLTEIATTLNTDSAMMNPFAPGHFSAGGYEVLGGAAGSTLGKHRK